MQWHGFVAHILQYCTRVRLRQDAPSNHFHCWGWIKPLKQLNSAYLPNPGHGAASRLANEVTVSKNKKQSTKGLAIKWYIYIYTYSICIYIAYICMWVKGSSLKTLHPQHCRLEGGRRPLRSHKQVFKYFFSPHWNGTFLMSRSIVKSRQKKDLNLRLMLDSLF